MLEDSVLGMYDEFVLEFFRSIFSMVKERDGSLSAMEAFSVEVIHELREPTIGKFAEFLNISQSNATYKVNNLIKKGYIEKQNSTTDRREYHLVLSEKYYKYTSVMRGCVASVARRIEDSTPREDVDKVSAMLRRISSDLKEECCKLRSEPDSDKGE